MATSDVDISDLPPPPGAAASPSVDISDLPPPPQQRQAEGPQWQTDLRNLDQKYTGGIGRQLMLGARAIPDAANGLLNIIPNGLTAAWNLATGQRNPLPSETIDKYLISSWMPKPETTMEKVANIGESMIAGAGMPIPGGFGANPTRPIGAISDPMRGPAISFNPAQAPGGMNRGDVAKALKILETRLNQDNTSMAPASQLVREANEQGIPMRLTDVGENTKTTGDLLAQRPGASRTIIRSDRQGISDDTIERVGERVRDNLDSHGDVGRYADILEQARGQHAKANYAAVKNDSQPIMDPDIWHVLENPDVARVYQEALSMDRRVRSVDATMGKSTPPLTTLYAPHPAPGQPTTAIQPAGGMASAASTGAQEWVRTQEAPSVRDLDFLQRALNTKVGQLYNQARNGVSTQGGEGDLATALKGARNFLVERLKDTSPSFKKAMETYGDDSEVLTAHEIGLGKGDGKNLQANFFQMTPAQAQQYVNGLSEAGKSALRMGVTEQLLGRTEFNGRNVDLAKMVMGGDRKQDLLWTLFDGDSSKFQAFQKAMNLESKLFRNNSSMMGGSQTMARQEAASQFENEMIPHKIGQAADVAAQGLLHRPGVFVHGLFRLMQSRMWSPSVASATSKILSSKDPEQAAQALQSIENQVAQRSMLQGAANKITQGIASGAPGIQGSLGTNMTRQQQLEQKYGVTQ